MYFVVVLQRTDQLSKSYVLVLYFEKQTSIHIPNQI